MAPTAMENTTANGKGKLIALEGDADTITTQLRLLPPSQKILVLPSLLENLPESGEKDIFDARIFVRDVHNLCSQRTAAARSFLNSSTSTQPRLVFMNGGSVKARATCITRISEAITGGDIEEAEEIFNEIVEDGVAGVLRHAAEAEAEETESDTTEASEASTDTSTIEDADTSADTVITKATTGSIEDGSVLRNHDKPDSSNHETTISDNGKSPAASGSIDEARNLEGQKLLAKQIAEEFVAQRRSAGGMISLKTFIEEKLQHESNELTESPGDEIRTTVLTMPNRSISKEKRNTFGSEHQSATTSTASHLAPIRPLPKKMEDFEDGTDLCPDPLSPGDSVHVLIPASPHVEYGGAYLVDVHSPISQGPVRKTKSVDRFFPSLFTGQPSSPRPKGLTHSKSAYPIRSKGWTADTQELFQTLPRTTFVRASETTIKRSPTVSSSGSPISSKSALPPRVFVDRGTDAGALAESTIEEEDAAYVPVFEVVEDLVINFTATGSNAVFDSVISSCKNGSYPAFPVPKPKPEDINGDIEEEQEISSSISSLDTGNRISTDLRPVSYLTIDEDASSPDLDDSYPPNVRRPVSQKTEALRADSAAPSLEPASLEIGQPDSRDIAHKFVDLVPVNMGNAISIQNSLRAILRTHCPASEGYSQHLYTASPGLERMWKPVFRDDETSTVGTEGRTVDQIIALGCEDGVKKEFSAQISGQIERLGIKKDGVNRSAKLDIRYLISNVMQRFTDIPTETLHNPLANPELLAELLVPQLETYLATNTTTRLLILQHTSEHLPAILALRKLLGVELFMAAGVLDTLSSDLPSFASRPRTPTSTRPLNPLSNEATSSPRTNRLNSLHALQRGPSKASSLSTKKPELPASFSKANYLLPSTATDSEITTFLTSIWKTLMEKSPFYAPESEPEPKPVIIEKPPKTPTLSVSPRDRELRDSGYPPSSFRVPRTERQSKISRLTGNSNLQPSQREGSKYAPSIASTTRTTASERGRREDRAWENFYIAEEDSEDDAYDKMILGRGYAKIVPEVRRVGAQAQKRNTKKALKWLGLA